MVKKRNWIQLIIIFVTTIVLSALLINWSVIDLNKKVFTSENFQYNAITMSTTISGFLFTGISILISTVDKERIKRLWDNNYLDNLYRAAFIGMISNIITVISAIIVICCSINNKIKNKLIALEIITLIVGIVFFTWCVKQLIFVILRLKKK